MINYSPKGSGNTIVEADLQYEKGLGSANFTVQCWLKTTESGPLFQEYYQDTQSYFLVEVTEGGKIRFSSKTEEHEQIIETIQGGINSNEWTHLVALKHENSLKIMVNGYEVPSNTINKVEQLEQFVSGVQVGRALFNSTETYFKGELRGVAIWNRDLSIEEIQNLYNQPLQDDERDLIFHVPFKDEECILQTVNLKVINDSPFDLQLSDEYKGTGWIETIKAHSENIITLESYQPDTKSYALYKSGDGRDDNTFIRIEAYKSLTYYKSEVTTKISDDLERQISVVKNTPEQLSVDLRLSENLVIVNAKHLNAFLNIVIPKIGKEHVVTSMNYNEKTGEATSTGEQIVRYNQSAQIFNRRIQKKPLAIIYCQNSDDVQLAYDTAIKYNLPIKVRSGGHDHEGECTGTNTILIDLIGLNTLDIFDATGDSSGKMNIAEIGPGNRFHVLTPKLAHHGRMIPHGTCATVAIPGFTMGGGWGPWTRRKGMCCEHLVGAEIILGDGSIETIASERIVRHKDGEDVEVLNVNKPELLWALKGGGGMSYGIVTKFYIKTFALEETLVKFELEWNPYNDQQVLQGNMPTIQILKRWEDVINSSNTPALTGTNLKINGKPLKIIGYRDELKCFPIYEKFDADTVVHNCVMYGYWEENKPKEETRKNLEDFIQASFTDFGLKPCVKIDGVGGLGKEYVPNLGKWDRESHSHVKLRMSADKGELDDEESLPYPPDLDDPAPHKITSRLVDSCGLSDKGHKQLLSSLTSPFILEGNREEGLFTYVTLGAIVGDFYNNLERVDLSAFPYKDRKYTIQYQTWWNLELAEKEKLQNNKVYTRTNRALDWIEASRDFKIENTSGAFISFKDNSIPTEAYFAQSYDRLKSIKERYSEDSKNHFRSRKTII